MLQITIGLLKKAMLKSGSSSFLIDGFPRALDQAQSFEEQIQPSDMVLPCLCMPLCRIAACLVIPECTFCWHGTVLDLSDIKMLCALLQFDYNVNVVGLLGMTVATSPCRCCSLTVPWT